MSATLSRAEPDFDLVVIGGGVNGTGLARDAALRGLRVALFERNDFGFGASGNSSGMIHGGVRYLSQDPEVTRTSCADSGHIQAIAPHLIFRIPFLMPIAKGKASRVMFDLIDAYFTAYDRYQPLKRGKPHARLSEDELRRLEPGLAGEAVGGISFDEWGIDGARLCIANAIDAKEQGALVRNHTTVETILRDASGKVRGVKIRSLLTGKAETLSARAVVNATGAWAPLTTTLGGLGPKAARVRPGKGIHIVFDRRITNYAVAAKAIDGRQIFIEPWQNTSILGTTDDDFYGDLDDVRATTEEVRYLVQGIARTLPAVAKARAIGTFAGVRPTLYEWGPGEDELSRDHRIVDHAAHGADGLYSMIGGKLASYRLFAYEMMERLAPRLGVQTPCTTHTRPLPGGEAPANEARMASEAGIDPIAARRLAYRHGARATRILERIRKEPREAAVVCPCEPVLEAEVRHVIREELACTVDDVSRRTRLGLGHCGGMRCAARCGQILSEERELSPREGLALAGRFLSDKVKTRVVALGPEQARQEALALASIRSELGLGGEDDE